MNLLKSSAVVSGMTLISRMLGFVRDMLLASLLGTGMVADAYVVAFRFPNLFRRLFGEGAFNAAFVPLFARRLEGAGADAARAFAGDVLSVLLVALLIFTAAAELTMPLLMYIIAPGFQEDPQKFDLAVLLTRIAFPYLGFMSLVALLSGVLNSTGRFAVAAAAPIILNIVLIAVLGTAALSDDTGRRVTGIALTWGVSLAGLLQFAMLWTARKAGFAVHFKKPEINDDVRRFVALGIPGVIAGGITQINILVGTIIASLKASAVSYLYYADRVYQLPLGVIGIAIGVVLLPDLSRRLRAADLSGADSSQNRALDFSLFLTLPAAVALMVMPDAIIQVLFERGAFVAADTRATSQALAVFAVGLPSFVMIKIFSPGFFAREDTRTPMIFAGLSVAINIAVSIALFPSLAHVGIAVGTTVSGWANAAALGLTLYRRGHYAPDERLLRHLPRIVLSAALMGLVLWAMVTVLTGAFSAGTGLAARIAALALLVGAGAVVYFVIAHLAGAFRLAEMKSVLRRE